MDDRDIFIIEVSRRGRDGDYTGASEVAVLKTRADALEARPNITSLNAVPNVDDADRAEGYVLQWDESAEAWIAAPSVKGIEAVWSDGYVPEQPPRSLHFLDGLYLQAHPSNPEVTRVRLGMGSSGSSNSVARANHTHTNPAPTRAPFGPQAYMSSGTRSLGSTNVTLASGVSYVVKARLNMQMRGADPGACYYQLRLTINGNARTSIGGQNGFWCVQGVPDKTTWEHHITMTGTGSAITISAHAIYFGGGGFYTDAGEIVVEPVPNR